MLKTVKWDFMGRYYESRPRLLSTWQSSKLICYYNYFLSAFTDYATSNSHSQYNFKLEGLWRGSTKIWQPWLDTRLMHIHMRHHYSLVLNYRTSNQKIRSWRKLANSKNWQPYFGGGTPFRRILNKLVLWDSIIYVGAASNFSLIGPVVMSERALISRRKKIYNKKLKLHINREPSGCLADH